MTEMPAEHEMKVLTPMSFDAYSVGEILSRGFLDLGVLAGMTGCLSLARWHLQC